MPLSSFRLPRSAFRVPRSARTVPGGASRPHPSRTSDWACVHAGGTRVSPADVPAGRQGHFISHSAMASAHASKMASPFSADALRASPTTPDDVPVWNDRGTWIASLESDWSAIPGPTPRPRRRAAECPGPPRRRCPGRPRGVLDARSPGRAGTRCRRQCRRRAPVPDVEVGLRTVVLDGHLTMPEGVHRARVGSTFRYGSSLCIVPRGPTGLEQGDQAGGGETLAERGGDRAGDEDVPGRRGTGRRGFERPGGDAHLDGRQVRTSSGAPRRVAPSRIAWTAAVPDMRGQMASPATGPADGFMGVSVGLPALCPLVDIDQSATPRLILRSSYRACLLTTRREIPGPAGQAWARDLPRACQSRCPSR